MKNVRGFKQKLAVVTRLWQEKNYDRALAEVESMLKTWPGNAHLHVLWASLVQLQDKPEHELNEAKQALQQAVELDKDSAAVALELGHFLDNVEDDPQAASRAFAGAVTTARQQLIEGLIGQARALRQLNRKEQLLRSVLELVQLTHFEAGHRSSKANGTGEDIVFESPNGHFYAVQLKGPYTEQIQDLLSEVAVRSPR